MTDDIRDPPVVAQGIKMFVSEELCQEVGRPRAGIALPFKEPGRWRDGMASKHSEERSFPMRKEMEMSGRTNLKSSMRRKLVRTPAESAGSSKADRGQQIREGMKRLLSILQCRALPKLFVITEILDTSVEKTALQVTIKSLVPQSVIVSRL